MTGKRPHRARQGTPGQRRAGALARALQEFALLPLLIVAGFVLLAAASILADQTHNAVVDKVRAEIGQLIGKQAATSTLQAVATGLVTVASITFSVLLLAVQQTASSLSPVVFDQFVRRRGNQVLFGFFVGLGLYAYVVMTAVPGDTSPIIGAALATLLTALALVGLLALVYTTINQMRPPNVMRQIRDRTLQARRRELELIRQTRRQEQSRHPVTATYRSDTTGYVTAIDLTGLARSLGSTPEAEVRLHITLGDHVAYGDTVATIRTADAAAGQRLAREVKGTVVFGVTPDLDNDATTGIDELGNIAWTSGSSAKHNPEIARQALHALHDIVARWVTEDAGHATREPWPIVYPDTDIDRVLDVLYSLIVVAHESQQHMTAARVLDTYAVLLPQVQPALLHRLRQDLQEAAPLLDDMPPSPMLKRARRRVETALKDSPGDARGATGPSTW